MRGLVRLMLVAAVGMILAGCDKCGHPMKLVTPSFNACGDNADPGRG